MTRHAKRGGLVQAVVDRASGRERYLGWLGRQAGLAYAAQRGR